MELATDNISPVDFRGLALQVRAEGLLERRPAFYLATVGLTIAALAGGWAAFAVVGASWAALGVAAFLGLVCGQLAFIGHDAGHQQIFASRRGNRLLGLVIGNFLVGLSYGWWVPKHGAHHSHPNELGHDPDVGSDVFGIFGDASTRQRAGIAGFLARWRASLFFPLMLLRSVGLHVGAMRELFARRDRAAAVDLALIFVHLATYFTVLVLVLGPLEAFVFVMVQHAVFSVYLGMSFAPNHKGMALIPPGAKVDFAHRQIVTSRNIAGGVLTAFALGGLNYQIEHHLFPSMPRPNLRRARTLVRTFCLAAGLDYCEVGFFESFQIIVRHLRARTSGEHDLSESPLYPVVAEP